MKCLCGLNLGAVGLAIPGGNTGNRLPNGTGTAVIRFSCARNLLAILHLWATIDTPLELADQRQSWRRRRTRGRATFNRWCGGYDDWRFFSGCRYGSWFFCWADWRWRRALVGIIAGLFEASAARAKGAKEENQAINEYLPSWDSGLQQIFAAANSGQITGGGSGFLGPFAYVGLVASGRAIQRASGRGGCFERRRELWDVYSRPNSGM